MKTAPIAPDPSAYGFVGVMSGLGVYWLTMRHGDGSIVATMSALFVAGAFLFYYLIALRRFKVSTELYDIWKRSQPAQPEPDTLYQIRGELTMHTQHGWMDIGEGVGTFYIKPPKRYTVWNPHNDKRHQPLPIDGAAVSRPRE